MAAMRRQSTTMVWNSSEATLSTRAMRSIGVHSIGWRSRRGQHRKAGLVP